MCLLRAISSGRVAKYQNFASLHIMVDVTLDILDLDRDVN